MFVQEEGQQPLRRKIGVTLLSLCVVFSAYKAYQYKLTSQALEEESKQTSLEIESFWDTAKEAVDKINLEADSFRAINKLAPSEEIAAELFKDEEDPILKNIEGTQEQVVSWESSTTGEVKVKLIAKLYLSGQSPPEGGKYAYAIMELVENTGKGNTLSKRYYPLDNFVKNKEERIYKIEEGEMLPPEKY